jgi:predicted glycosyltransferase
VKFLKVIFNFLHPNHFTPDPKIVEAYGIDTSKPYFVMRFASLNAHHDSGIKGINTEIAQRLIDILEGSGLDHFESSDPSRLVPLSTNSPSNNSLKVQA